MLLTSHGILLENLPEARVEKKQKKAKQVLTEMCSEYGIVLYCSEVERNPSSNRRLKFEAHVIFANEDSCELAIKHLNDMRHTGSWKEQFHSHVYGIITSHMIRNDF